MTIFCDTNILLEYLQQRQYVAEVKKILSSAIKNNDIAQWSRTINFVFHLLFCHTDYSDFHRLALLREKSNHNTKRFKKMRCFVLLEEC